jgi:hypothetical protein
MNLVPNEMQKAEKTCSPAVGFFQETGSQTTLHMVRIALLLVHCGGLFKGTLRQG